MSLFNKICFYIFFTVIFALLFTSCINKLDPPNSDGNEKPEVIGPANSDIAINRIISPEKRSLIDFWDFGNGDFLTSNDSDLDGFDITIDPDPFDINMPYVQYANCYFPVLYKNGSGYKISYSSEEKPRSGNNSNLDSKGFNISKLSFNMSDINDLTTFQENLVYSDTTSDSDSVLDWTEKFYDDDNNIVNFYAIGSKSNSTYLGGNYSNDAPLEKNLLMNSISLINMIMSKNTSFDDLQDIIFAGDADVTSLITGWGSTKGFTSSVIPNADSENYIHFNNKFLSVLGEGWGLPSNSILSTEWKNYPTELLLFTSKKSANSNIEVNGIKNTINYSPYERKNDKYQINFLGDISSDNLESVTMVKILIEKNDDAYNVKFFFSGTPATEFANYINNNSSLRGCFNNKVSFKSLFQSGFTIEGESLQYDLDADSSKFGNTIKSKLYDEVEYLKKTGELINKLDKEIYTIFLAVVPKAEDDFIVVGSNVHFRPNIPDTVIAPIRNNKITTRPKVLPPNYLMAPETAESILDLYFREPSYLEKDLFNIDVGFDEKLLFIQGSNTKIVSTFDGRWLPKSTSIAAPSTHTPNPVLFISNGIEYICEAEVFEMSTLGDNYYSKILSKYYNSLKNPIAYTIDINRDNITGKNSGTLVIRQNQFITNSNVLYSKMNLSFNNGEITSAEVDVDFDADDSKQRFIPNTDRVGNQSKERTKSVGINIPVKINHIAGFDGDINVIIKPPLDPTYNKITVAESEDFNSQKNNFDNNAVFNLHAVFDDGSDRVLATFNPLPEEQRSSIRQYSVSYNSNFFGGSGLGHIGYSLYRTGSDGTLTFKTSGNVKATKFAISMENSDIGDDIKLCFGFENSDIIAKSTDGDFFAVYDKKMLWRANLYIKENNNDWNDDNPWIEGNDWNRVHDGETSFKKIGGNPNREDDLNRGNGGQVVQIAEYTPIWKKVGERDNNIIDDAVSYSYPANGELYNREDWDPQGHMDSPFDFNKKVIEQIDLEDLYYNETGEKFVQSRDNWPNYPDTTMEEDLNTEVLFEENAFEYEGNNFPEGTKSIEPWDNTTAPDNKWWQYIREETDDKTPFIPGLGLHYYKNGAGEQSFRGRTDDGTESQVDDAIGDIGDMVEAGTDCLGFAQRSASYIGNEYSWRDLPLGYAESGTVIDGGAIRTFPRTKADADSDDKIQYSKLLFDRNAFIALGVNQAITGIRIVPGDIMYYLGNSTHIAIIDSVEYEDDGSILIENIRLIESTWYYPNRLAEVINTYTLDDYDDKAWKIVRLIRE